MILIKMKKILNQFLCITLGALSYSAYSQEFPPKKTITMVVGFAAGGAADTAARQERFFYFRMLFIRKIL